MELGYVGILVVGKDKYDELARGYNFSLFFPSFFSHMNCFLQEKVLNRSYMVPGGWMWP